VSPRAASSEWINFSASDEIAAFDVLLVPDGTIAPAAATVVDQYFPSQPFRLGGQPATLVSNEAQLCVAQLLVQSPIASTR
jgi:hypothetical protein